MKFTGKMSLSGAGCRRYPATLAVAVLATAACASLMLASQPVEAGWQAEADFRYRLERVEQANLDSNTTASTARLRLNAYTPSWHGFDAMAGFHANRVIGETRYNDTTGTNPERPVVADPADTGLAQSWLRYTAEEIPLTGTVGRQRLILDDARFLGNVGFRQLEQTFDAAHLQWGPGNDWSGSVIHLDRAHRIFGPNHPDPAMSETDLNAWLGTLNREWEGHRASIYVHRFGNEDNPDASHANDGIRLTGPMGGLDYLAEFARQTEHRSGGPEAAQHYVHLRLAGEVGDGWQWHLGHERLGGDGDAAFQTPFATLHAFNGWADQFLTTPETGLRDTYVGASPPLPGAWTLTGRIHDFRADQGGESYGREFNLVANRDLPQGWNLELKAARYDADSFAQNTTKAWITLANRW